MLALQQTRALIDRARTDTVSAADAEVRRFFETAPGVTDELVAQASRGALPLDDFDRLAALFAERLRHVPGLAWIGYADAASGRYVGATRYDDDEIVEYIANPNVDGGMPRQTAVTADGQRLTPSHVENNPYLVVTKPWYQLGIKTPGPTWTNFYQFTSGGPGITCMTRFTAPGAGAPTGLFHADLRVERIATFFTTMRIGDGGGVFLTDKNGRRLVSPATGAAPSAGTAVDLVAARGVATPDTPFTASSGGNNYEIVFKPIAVKGDLRLDLAVDIDLADVTAGIYRQALIASVIAAVATLLAAYLGVLLSSRIARPITVIASDMTAIGNFALSPQPAPRSFVREIAELGEAVDRMKANLRSFSHYVPTDLVRRLLAAGKEAELGGEVRQLTIFFSDVRNFTTMSEGMPPGELVAAMGRYFELMTTAITRHHGTVDKFMGDGIMAFYNAPGDLSDHARQACLGALEAQAALAAFARDSAPGQPDFATRIGLGLGEVLVGNIGTPTRFQYTLLGDQVNLASRLESLNKLYGTLIMGNEALFAEAGTGFEWRRLDRVAVKGRYQGTLVYELLGERGATAENVLTARDVYERALDAYFAGDFLQAEAGFKAAAACRSNDLASRMMAERSHELAAAPPSEWNGIHVMHEK